MWTVLIKVIVIFQAGVAVHTTQLGSYDSVKSCQAVASAITSSAGVGMGDVKTIAQCVQVRESK